MHYTVSYNTLYKTNDFLAMPKIKAILKLIKEGNYNNPHLNNFKRRYLVDNNKNMQDIKYITLIKGIFISKYTIFNQLKSGI